MGADTRLKPVLNAAEVNALMAETYPQLNADVFAYETIDVFPGGCTVRLHATERHLRPGNTVSGPCLFTLADIGGYACVLSHAGPDALSVTTNLSINFMRKAGPGPVDVRDRVGVDDDDRAPLEPRDGEQDRALLDEWPTPTRQVHRPSANTLQRDEVRQSKARPDRTLRKV